MIGRHNGCPITDPMIGIAAGPCAHLGESLRICKNTRWRAVLTAARCATAEAGATRDALDAIDRSSPGTAARARLDSQHADVDQSGCPLLQLNSLAPVMMRPPTPAESDAARRAHPTLPHVVVIGGGFGGLAAVRALRGAPVRITLVDRLNHHLFQPLLYQVATGLLSPANIAAPLRGLLRRQQNVRVRLGEVTTVDTERRHVSGAGEKEGFQRSKLQPSVDIVNNIQQRCRNVPVNESHPNQISTTPRPVRQAL